MIHHGTRSCYSLGCRCPECRQANRDYPKGQTPLRPLSDREAPQVLKELGLITQKYLIGEKA